MGETRTIRNRMVEPNVVESYIEETGEVIDRRELPTPPAPADTGAGWLTMDGEKIRAIRAEMSGRTKYVGRTPFRDELLMAECEALLAELAKERTARQQAEAQRDAAITLEGEARWLVSLIDNARVATSNPEAPTSWRRGDYFVHLTRQDEDRIAALRARLATLRGEG